MTYDEIISKAAESLGFTKILVDNTYKAFWKAIREHVTSLPLKDDITDEEFAALKVNINIPSIGKLYVNNGRRKAINKAWEEKVKEEKIKEENKKEK